MSLETHILVDNLLIVLNKSVNVFDTRIIKLFSLTLVIIYNAFFKKKKKI